MEEGGGSKANGIRRIVRLKAMLHQWRNVTKSSNTSNRSSNNATNKSTLPMINRSSSCKKYCKSDDEEDNMKSPELLHDVPKGYLAVYVGPEHRRFIIPTSYLGHSVFKRLLEKAAEEFGFNYQSGGLTIPCDIETFKYILKCMENHEKDENGDDDCGNLLLSPGQETARAENSGTSKE